VDGGEVRGRLGCGGGEAVGDGGIGRTKMPPCDDARVEVGGVVCGSTEGGKWGKELGGRVLGMWGCC